MHSPLARRYRSWRDTYLQSALGRQAWAALDAIPAQKFTLGMVAAPGNVNSGTGADTTNIFDAQGNQVAAEIAFSSGFGGDPGHDAATAMRYAHGQDVFANDQGGFIQYAFGHEIGHVVGGWDPAAKVDAQQFVQNNQVLLTTATQYGQLLRIGAQRTRPQQQQFLALQRRRNAVIGLAAGLGRSGTPGTQNYLLDTSLEPYADDFGYQIYRSFRQTHSRLFRLAPVGGRSFIPPPQVPLGVIPPP